MNPTPLPRRFFATDRDAAFRRLRGVARRAVRSLRPANPELLDGLLLDVERAERSVATPDAERTYAVRGHGRRYDGIRFARVLEVLDDLREWRGETATRECLVIDELSGLRV